jgi:hypothetical protein
VRCECVYVQCSTVCVYMSIYIHISIYVYKCVSMYLWCVCCVNLLSRSQLNTRITFPC